MDLDGTFVIILDLDRQTEMFDVTAPDGLPTSVPVRSSKQRDSVDGFLWSMIETAIPNPVIEVTRAASTNPGTLWALGLANRALTFLSAAISTADFLTITAHAPSEPPAGFKSQPNVNFNPPTGSGVSFTSISPCIE